jgi:hypothetical protein
LEHGGAMPRAAGGDGGAERHDLRRVGLGPLQVVERPLGDVVQIGPVALDELDDDRFLGLEVVIQAAGQDAAGIRDLLDGRPQPGGGEQPRGCLEDLRSPHTIYRHNAHS